MKRLLIVFHTQGGHTGALAEAVLRGARRATETDTVMKRAGDATLEDLLGCHGLIVGTPENFGTMSGMVKDFFDRTYYAVLGRVEGRPYASIVCAGSDGQGAARQIDRIATGWRLRRVADPLVVITNAQTPQAILATKRIGGADLARAHDLGSAMAAGVSLGVW